MAPMILRRWTMSASVPASNPNSSVGAVLARGQRTVTRFSISDPEDDDLHQASVRSGREAPGGGKTVEGRHVHGVKLRPGAAKVSAASPTCGCGSPVSLRGGLLG